MVRGRSLRSQAPVGELPDYTVYLLGLPPRSLPSWSSEWVCWPDLMLPLSSAAAREVLTRAWSLSSDERVEVVCTGGRGRTGTALACVAVLDGVRSDEAVAYVRRHYDPRAVETAWQRRYVERFRLG